MLLGLVWYADGGDGSSGTPTAGRLVRCADGRTLKLTSSLAGRADGAGPPVLTAR
ncbi:hypothetical protein [Streptomyces sp. NPDC047071]|uniref:hypothetical protein n=1 Tax=Streptomyces sp. NPDC047071 TaxID=3154808 RepID=UPI00345415DF